MDRVDVIRHIRTTGLIAILRHTDSNRAIETGEALKAAGVTVVEVTMNTAGAVEMVRALTRHFGDSVAVGAGTVLSIDAAQQAIEAGARLIVSPHFDEELVHFTVSREIAVIPGAFTPTEIFRASSAGANFVKVFPAGPVGPRYIKDVLAPLNEIPLVPTGGVNLDNAAEFIRAGASALGLGSALVDPRLVASGQYAKITETARAFLAAVREGRGTKG